MTAISTRRLNQTARGGISVGFVTALLFALVLLAPLIALALWAHDQNAAERVSYPLWNVASFTLLQASLSTLFSVVFGLLLAWSISHCQSGWLKSLARLSLLLPLVMPVVTICLAWHLLLGTQGLSGWLGIRRPYGLAAILSVHVFINMALVAWMCLPAWDKAPTGYWRTAKMLDMSGWQLWRQLEWPLLKPYVLRAAALTFLFCFTSFAPVFLLGGGPKYTTFETAIYAAMRTNFDPVYALILGAIQFAICFSMIALVFRYLPDHLFRLGNQTPRHRLSQERFERSRTATIIACVLACICLAPFISILFSALESAYRVATGSIGRASMASFATLPAATLATLWVIVGAMLSSLLVGWSLSYYKIQLDQRGLLKRAAWLDLLGGAVYALPALILGAGWLALMSLFNLWQSVQVTYIAFISITLLIGVPVVMRATVPAYQQLDLQYGKLCQQLDLRGWQKIRQVDWPRLKPILILSSAYAGIMSAGDLGAFILVSQDNVQTLPILIQRQMGSYQNSVASISALALILTQAFWLLLMAAIVLLPQRSKRGLTSGFFNKQTHSET